MNCAAVFGILLLPCVLTDLRERRIPALYVLILCALGIVLNLIRKEFAFWEILCGMLPGCMLLPVSLRSGKTIGLGDCFLIIACGAWCGFTGEIPILLCSFFLLGMTGGIGRIIFGKCVKRSFPYAPFLGVSCGMEMLRQLYFAGGGG